MHTYKYEQRSPGPLATCHIREKVKGVNKERGREGRKRKRKRQKASEADRLRRDSDTERQTDRDRETGENASGRERTKKQPFRRAIAVGEIRQTFEVGDSLQGNERSERDSVDEQERRGDVEAGSR